MLGEDEEPHVQVLAGIDVLFDSPAAGLLKGKRVGLITNHTAINREMVPSAEVLRNRSREYYFRLKALFAPEHGLTGAAYAFESVDNCQQKDGTPIYSLYGSQQRPTIAMLRDIDILIYDIQDIGSRSYTYTTTLFYAMEEAAKNRIPLIVLDRPNPINGVVIDGPMLDDRFRSIVGYINVPYCHGMTAGELAQLFNMEYNIGCQLTVVPMRGWDREMSFADTGLPWIPTSPQIPDESTPLYYPMTGILGELSIVSIGVGYTLPFKVVGAPWINAEVFAKALNAQKFKGVHFQPFHFKPFFGKFANQACQGVYIIITDPLEYLPVSTQYLVIGFLKSLYPKQFEAALKTGQSKKELFCKVNGNEEIYRIIAEEKNIVWSLRAFDLQQRQRFASKRRKYLLYR
jgi:uncharacterized protein YbbC (DUF1343 family)